MSENYWFEDPNMKHVRNPEIQILKERNEKLSTALKEMLTICESLLKDLTEIKKDIDKGQ